MINNNISMVPLLYNMNTYHSNIHQIRNMIRNIV